MCVEIGSYLIASVSGARKIAETAIMISVRTDATIINVKFTAVVHTHGCTWPYMTIKHIHCMIITIRISKTTRETLIDLLMKSHSVV